MTTLSLVIPCYNEAKNLPLLVERIKSALARPAIEVILVDNGSTDDTPLILPALLAGQASLRSHRVAVNQGYGFGIVSGLREARGDILGWTHADMQTDPADALRGLALLQAAPDPRRLFVKGRRRGRPFGDVFFTCGMSLFETILLQAPLNDINAQPTLFHRSFFSLWRNPPGDFSLDLYACYMARRHGLEIRRFPVTFGARAHGVSHWNIGWRSRLKFIRRTVGYSLRLRRIVKGEAK